MPTYVPVDRDAFERELTRRGLSIRALADSAGVCTSTISKAKNGHYRLQLRTWRKLNEALARHPVVVDVMAGEQPAALAS